MEKSHRIPLKNQFWDLLYNLWETLSTINSTFDFLFIQQMLNITLFLSLCENICINSRKLRCGHLRRIYATRLLSYLSISAFTFIRAELITTPTLPWFILKLRIQPNQDAVCSGYSVKCLPRPLLCELLEWYLNKCPPEQWGQGRIPSASEPVVLVFLLPEHLVDILIFLPLLDG